MKKIAFILVILFVGLKSVTGQSLVNTCWDAIDQTTGDYWKIEYLTGDSLFMTGYYSNGNIHYTRTHFGWYDQTNDTLSIMFFSWHPCGTVTGMYTYTISNSQLNFTLVNDSCSGREGFFTMTHSHFSCNSQSQPLINSCWVAIHKSNGSYIVMELTSNNSVYVTAYSNQGVQTAPRTQNGTYYNSNDTVVFINPPSSLCQDSGVYTYSVSNSQLNFSVVNDPCASRLSNITTRYDYFDCSSINIRIDKSFPIQEKEVTVYPNPASDLIIIEKARHEFKDQTKVILFDLIGNEITKQNIGSSNKKIKINVAYLKSGIYLLKLLEDNYVLFTERIIIVK